MPIKSKAILFEQHPDGNDNAASRWLQLHTYPTASLPTAPGTTNAGSIVFDTTTSQTKVWNGTAWVPVATIKVDLQDILDSNSNELLEFDLNASAVNYIRLANAATGNAPAISAQGDDANVDLSLAAKGTGSVTVSSGLGVTSGELEIVLTDNGAAGGTLLLGQVSNSPAANDAVGIIEFEGQDDAGPPGADVTYATINGSILDPTAGAEFGAVGFQAQNGTGTIAQCGNIRHDGATGMFSAGDATGPGVFQSEGNQDVVIRTGNAASSNITITDGAAGAVDFNMDATGPVNIVSTDAGALGAQLHLDHQSASPAIADIAGRIVFFGRDDAANQQGYGQINGDIDVVTDGTEQGHLSFWAANGAGALAQGAIIANNGTNGVIMVGDGAGAGILQSVGSHNVVLQTGNATTGNITITDGADGNIALNVNGTGLVTTNAMILSTANGGTAGANVNSQEFGDGLNHVTVLGMAGLAVPGPTAAAAEAHGYLLYTFPPGAHLHSATTINVALQGGGVANADTPDVGIGSTEATGAQALLSGVGATAEDYITGQTATDCNGTATTLMSGATAGIHTGISVNQVGDVKEVWLNYADTWAGADTLAATGVVVLKWTLM